MVDIYFEELIMIALHPKRISAWLDAGFEDFYNGCKNNTFLMKCII